MHIRHSGCALKPRDRIALTRGSRVVFCRHDHVYGSAGVPFQVGVFGDLAAGCRKEQLPERGAQACQHRLGFRVAKASVEFDDAHAAAGNGEPAEEHAYERGAAFCHARDGGAGDLFDHFVHKSFGQPVKWGVGAHPAGVWAFIVVKDALEILRRRQREHVLSVADDEERHFGTVQEFFDHHGTAGGKAGVRML